MKKSDWTKKRKEHGTEERRQVDMWWRYRKQERKKAGTTNHEDHFEEVYSVLMKWISNPKLKSSGRKAFERILLLVVFIADEVTNAEFRLSQYKGTVRDSLKAYHKAALESEFELKQLKKERAADRRELESLRVQVDELQRTRQALIKEIEYYERNS